MCNLQLKQVEYRRYVAFLRFECHLNCAIKYSVKNQILPVLNIIFFSWKLQSNISFDFRGQFFMKFVSIKPFFFCSLLKRCYLIIKKGWIYVNLVRLLSIAHLILFFYSSIVVVGCIQRKRNNVSTEASINPLECRIFCVFSLFFFLFCSVYV